MENVNKTLYIPLYGKAYVSRRGILLRDPDAERIWNAEQFPLQSKSRSKWLALYMGMRAAVFDRWLGQTLAHCPDAVVLHIGCGMDSRVNRVETREQLWFDVDFPAVIRERRRYYAETASYHMVGTDIRDRQWLKDLPQGRPAVVVMEGVSMYLSREELNSLLTALMGRFDQLHILMDCYSQFAARASRYKNPINEVGVTQVYGLDDPESLALETGLVYRSRQEITPKDLVDQLRGMERAVFRRIYAGAMADKLYHIYEFERS